MDAGQAFHTDETRNKEVKESSNVSKKPKTTKSLVEPEPEKQYTDKDHDVPHLVVQILATDKLLSESDMTKVAMSWLGTFTASEWRKVRRGRGRGRTSQHDAVWCVRWTPSVRHGLGRRMTWIL